MVPFYKCYVLSRDGSVRVFLAGNVGGEAELRNMIDGGCTLHADVDGERVDILPDDVEWVVS